MIFPDFQGNSIVNLMSTFLSFFNGKSEYPNLKGLSEKEFDNIKNIVCIVIDGLGYNYLLRHGKNSPLLSNLKGKMTTVFPSTTAAAMTSYYTGLAPKNHGIPTWYTYLKELGLISTILLFENRGTKKSLETNNISAEKIYDVQSLFKNIQAKQYLIIPHDTTETPYSRSVTSHFNRCGYDYGNIKSFFSEIQNWLIDGENNVRKYILGHWPNFDSSCHKFGVEHPKTLDHFQNLMGELEKFIIKIKKLSPETKIFISADHGLIDTPQESIISMDDHPKLASCLTMPTLGEARAPFFFVRPSKVKKFEKYISENLSYAGTLMKGDEAIERGYLGSYKEHPKFYGRIGDYIFFLKKDYIISEFLEGERHHYHVGNHGGVSEDEMYVPLFVF